MVLGALLAATATACSSGGGPAPDPREGPAPAWSFVGPTGLATTAMAGRVLVIKNDEAVLGVDPASGRRLWSVPSSPRLGIRIVRDLVVQVAREQSDVREVTVLDSSTGRVLWRKAGIAYARITQDAIFAGACAGKACAVTRYDPRSGAPKWTRPGDAWLSEDDIGARRPDVPPTGRLIAASMEPTGNPSFGARDAASGTPLPGRVSARSWTELAVGGSLVAIQNDPPEGDNRCTVTVTSADAASGAKRWQRQIFGGRAADGSCVKRLVPDSTGLTLIGAGTRIAASTDNGFPQVFDLATGRTVWRAADQAVPIDGDGRTLLVRTQADRGALSLLDFATGRRLWTAPDPGLEGTSASWKTSVTSRLVAITGATGDRPRVLVYRADTGQRLGMFPGWLQGLGDDWVAVGHSPKEPQANKLQYDFIRL